MENTLGRTEFDFQDVLRAVRRKLPLTLTQKAKLSVFTAAMLGRCTRQGDHWKQQWDSHVEKIKRIERRYVAEGALMSDQLVEANQDSHARLVINTIATCAPILFAMNLTILTADDRLGFITSDAPAVMYNPRAHTLSPLYRSPGLKYPDVEITLPLSPKYTALFTHKPIGSFYLPLEQRLINEVNRTTYFHCENEFVSRTGDWDDVWFEEREMPVDAWERQQSRFVEE